MIALKLALKLVLNEIAVLRMDREALSVEQKEREEASKSQESWASILGQWASFF